MAGEVARKAHRSQRIGTTAIVTQEGRRRTGMRRLGRRRIGHGGGETATTMSWAGTHRTQTEQAGPIRMHGTGAARQVQQCARQGISQDHRTRMPGQAQMAGPQKEKGAAAPDSRTCHGSVRLRAGPDVPALARICVLAGHPAQARLAALVRLCKSLRALWTQNRNEPEGALAAMAGLLAANGSALDRPGMGGQSAARRMTAPAQ